MYLCMGVWVCVWVHESDQISIYIEDIQVWFLSHHTQASDHLFQHLSRCKMTTQLNSARL